MSAPTPGATTTGFVSTGNITLTSWTPSAGESLWLFVDTRATGITPSISGNGQTWASLTSVLNAQSQHKLWAYYVASVSSPSTGSITVTLTGNTTPAVAACVRVSGQHASTPLDTSSTNAGPPSVDDDDMKHSITPGVSDALVLAWGGYRNRRMNALGAGETSLVDDLTDGGGGGNETTASLWYETVATPASTELGADNCLSGATDWSVILVSVAPAAAAAGQPTMRRFGKPPHRPVNIGRKSQGGVWFVGSPTPALARAA